MVRLRGVDAEWVEAHAGRWAVWWWLHPDEPVLAARGLRMDVAISRAAYLARELVGEEGVTGSVWVGPEETREAPHVWHVNVFRAVTGELLEIQDRRRCFMFREVSLAGLRATLPARPRSVAEVVSRMEAVG